MILKLPAFLVTSSRGAREATNGLIHKVVYISEMQPLPQELAFGIELRAKAKILRLISKRCIAQTKLQLQIKQNLDA